MARQAVSDLSVSILIADSHRLVSEALAEALLRVGGFRINLATNVDAMREVLLLQGSHDLVLLSPELPGLDGLASVPTLTAVNLPGRLALFTSLDHPIDPEAAINCGAAGLLSKAQPFDSLLLDICALLRGEPRFAQVSSIFMHRLVSRSMVPVHLRN